MRKWLGWFSKLEAKNRIDVVIGIVVIIILIVLEMALLSGAIKTTYAVSYMIIIPAFIVCTVIAIIRGCLENNISKNDENRTAEEMRTILTDRILSIISNVVLIVGICGALVSARQLEAWDGFLTFRVIFIMAIVGIYMVRNVLKYKRTKKELDERLSDSENK